MLLVLEMARQDVEGGSATQEGQGSGQTDAVSHLRFMECLHNVGF